MQLFEIFSVEPLEPHGNMKYSSFASNGGALLFFGQARRGIDEYCPQLHFLDEHTMPGNYIGLCYDDAERCYWSCSNHNSDSVYLLSDSFREVDRFKVDEYDPCFGPVRGIAYDRQDDCLLLTYAHRVLAVDKRTFCTKAVIHCDCAHTYRSCIRSCGYYYTVARQCGAESLTISQGGREAVHLCPPAGHRLLGMAEMCSGGQALIYFLSVKHEKYFFVLKGALMDTPGGGIPCADNRSHPDLCEPLPRSPGDSSCCRRPSVRLPQGCGQHCHGLYGSRHCTEYEFGHHSHSFSEWDAWHGGASVIESVALEQTALSHILNAEGEKIQKVLAVSDRPADFLSVNQSVLEVITKVTHLEQVLLAKLELACEVIRENKRR